MNSDWDEYIFLKQHKHQTFSLYDNQNITALLKNENCHIQIKSENEWITIRSCQNLSLKIYIKSDFNASSFHLRLDVKSLKNKEIYMNDKLSMLYS